MLRRDRGENEVRSQLFDEVRRADEVELPGSELILEVAELESNGERLNLYRGEDHLVRVDDVLAPRVPKLLGFIEKVLRVTVLRPPHADEAARKSTKYHRNQQPL